MKETGQEGGEDVRNEQFFFLILIAGSGISADIFISIMRKREATPL